MSKSIVSANNKNRFSIIIPTMQKDLDVLNKLVAELVEDISVGEILIIDNSLKGYLYPNEKIKVYIPKKNLYVNPSWNYGIKKAKYNMLGILNDDLIIPRNLCSQVLNFIIQNKNCGLIGLDSSKIIETPKEEFNTYPVDCVLECDEINNTYCTSHWGAAIFGRKKRFIPIPKKIKIWCGDNWLLKKNLDKKYISYEIKSAQIKHLGSLTCKSKHLDEIKRNDIYEYAKYDSNYLKHPMYRKKDSFAQKVFSLKNDKRGYKVITIFGIKLKIKKNVFDNFLQNVFSLKNDNKGHKIISLFGLKFKTKKGWLNGLLVGFKHLQTIKIRPNSILMVEVNEAHGEVLVGMAKYFLDLGFNIDILLSRKEKEFNPFARINDSRLRIFEMTPLGAKTILANKKTKKYKYVYFNSDIYYYKERIATRELFKKVAVSNNKIIQMCHRLEYKKTYTYKDLNLLMLANLPIEVDKKPKIVNTHYFGEIKNNPKNKIVNFIVVGNIQSARKNFDLLINAVVQLVESGIKNFKITVVSRTGTLKNIPEEIKEYFDLKGSLNYPDMYDEMEKADFFLPLLDAEDQKHDRYITFGTSGSFQLIYGFLKPCIIHEKFANVHYFDNENSIIYEANEEFSGKIREAILLPDDEYTKMRNKLKTTSMSISNVSCDNLKKILMCK